MKFLSNRFVVLNRPDPLGEVRIFRNPIHVASINLYKEL